MTLHCDRCGTKFTAPTICTFCEPCAAAAGSVRLVTAAELRSAYSRAVGRVDALAVVA